MTPKIKTTGRRPSYPSWAKWHTTDRTGRTVWRHKPTLDSYFNLWVMTRPDTLNLWVVTRQDTLNQEAWEQVSRRQHLGVTIRRILPTPKRARKSK